MPRNPETVLGSAADFGASTEDKAITAAAAEWFARCDAGLTIAQTEAFQRWLAADSRHRSAFARLDSAWAAFGKPAQTGGADELLQELATRAARRRRRVNTAAVALLALLAIGAVWRFLPPGDSATALPPTATLLVPERQVLPDGSVVILKDGAQVGEAFTGAIRHVILKQGEAVFEVVKNQRRPFVVSAGDVAVRAVGTAFSIQLGSHEVEVLVTEGAVEVGRRAGRPARNPGTNGVRGSETADNFHSQPLIPFVVPAGNRIVVEIAANAIAPQVLPVAATELSERLAWRNRRVEFSGTPLAEAVGLLNREAATHSRLQLIVDDPALESMRISGIFRTDNMDAFVLLLEAGFGVNAERSERKIVLRKASELSVLQRP